MLSFPQYILVWTGRFYLEVLKVSKDGDFFFYCGNHFSIGAFSEMLESVVLSTEKPHTPSEHETRLITSENVPDEYIADGIQLSIGLFSVCLYGNISLLYFVSIFSLRLWVFLVFFADGNFLANTKDPSMSVWYCVALIVIHRLFF